MKNTKKYLALFLSAAMMLTLAACGSKTEEAAPASEPAVSEAEAAEEAPASEAEAAEEVQEEAAAEEPASEAEAPASEAEASGESEVAKKVCFLTNSPLGNDFTDLIWKGIQDLGWESQCIETSEEGEYEDQIRAMAEEGYDIMYIFGDDIGNVALELAPELAESNPNMHIFILDTYMEVTEPNVTAVAVDTFESSFLAGIVACSATEVNKVGWIGHKEMFKITRFRDGFFAGVNFYNKEHGTNIESFAAFTNDPFDVTKGYETGISMIDTYGVDVIYQCDYMGGPGVIQACSEKGIKCIGVDDWQGDIDPCVFWSAIKSMDVVTNTISKEYQAGTTEYGAFCNFNLASGTKAYDERDEQNVSPETLAEIKDVMARIADGSIDIYEGFDDYRP